MLTFLPAGLLGLMVAGLLAAYVSTISTHLNWGTSYLVHDFYRRFLRPGETEHHYVMVGRILTGGMMALAGLLTLVLESARDNFNLMLSIGAGTGLLYLLRWYWWRINAWTEIAAMVSSFLLAVGFFVAQRLGVAPAAHVSLLWTVAVTSVVWIATAYMTAPTDRATLISFYKRARPAGPGWRDIRRASGNLPPLDNLNLAFVGWASGCVFVFSALFGTGHFLLGNGFAAMVATACFLASGILLLRLIPKLWAR
jgi:Na+/proline symporter